MLIIIIIIIIIIILAKVAEPAAPVHADGKVARAVRLAETGLVQNTIKST